MTLAPSKQWHFMRRPRNLVLQQQNEKLAQKGEDPHASPSLALVNTRQRGSQSPPGGQAVKRAAGPAPSRRADKHRKRNAHCKIVDVRFPSGKSVASRLTKGQ